MSGRLVGGDALIRRLNAISKSSPVLRDIQKETIKEAKLRVPRKSSFLGRSIIPGDLTPTFTIVQANANYAAHVEFGTRPHVIRPKNKKALSWTEGKRLSGRNRTGRAAGARFFAKKVRHPGTRPQPFLLPAAVEAVKQVGLQPIIEAWNDAA